MGMRKTGVSIRGLMIAFLLPPVAVRFGWGAGFGLAACVALFTALLSESVTMHATATAMGTSLTISFAGMFFASPLFGLAADLPGSYGASWLGLAGWTAVAAAC